MRPTKSLVATLLSLAGSAQADPTWPHVNDELEEIMFQTSGFRARLFTDNVRQCANEASGPGRKNAAEWLRTGFHDMATANRYFQTGGIDGSLQYELNNGENTGPGLGTTLKFLGNYLSSRSSLADLIAIGVYASVRSCGGPIIPVRGGRKDATEAGPVGVPQTQNPTATFVTQFDRMGFNQAEMIQLVACGHSLGGVHSVDFPDIVPAGTGGANGVIGLDSTEAAYDNKIVTEYLDGTTKNPLIVGPSVPLRKNSDGRVFGADGNVTMNSLRDPAAYQTACRNILQRMIEVVPAGVALTDPITPYTVKPVDMQLTLGSQSMLTWTGYVRIRTTTTPLSSIRNVVLTYRDRSGGTNCGTCQTTLNVQGTGAGIDDTWAYFPVNALVSASTGISAFTITVNKVDGTSTRFDNNGVWYPLTDAIMLQRPQSCLLQGSGALTVSALVRNDRTEMPVQLGISYQTTQTNSPVPKLNSQTLTMTKGDCVGTYTFYSATHTIPGDKSFAAKLDVVSGTGSDIQSDSFNTAADLGGTCLPFNGNQTCASVTVSSSIATSQTSTCCAVTTTVSSGSSGTTPSSTSATPTPTGPSHKPTVGDYKLVGCWTEGSGVRALSGATFIYDGMTLENCMANCTGFSYWATEYGRECYCGNSLDASSSSAPLSDCNMVCSGDPNQYCGAGNRLELYAASTLASSSTTTTATTTSGGGSGTTSTSTSATPTSTALSRVQKVGPFSYNGCWTEGNGVRALADKSYADDKMTLDMCAAHCSTYQYFGTEYGRECWCGNTLASSSQQAPQADCSMTCGGNQYQYCGAGNRLELYQIRSSGSATSSSSSTSSPGSGAGSTSSTTTPTPTTTTSTATGPPTNTPTVTVNGNNWTFLGCWTEGQGVRALTGAFTAADDMTIQKCAAFCAPWTYFGTEYERECYCGNSLASSANQAADSECNMVCKGDRTQFCGGSLRLTIYVRGT